MIEHHLDPATSILLVKPQSALDKNDFVEMAKAVDPQIEAHGDLAGLIIEAPHFPAGTVSARSSATCASSATTRSTSRRSRWSPTRTSATSPST